MSNAHDLQALLGETSWIHALARRLVSDLHLAADLSAPDGPLAGRSQSPARLPNSVRPDSTALEVLA